MSSSFRAHFSLLLLIVLSGFSTVAQTTIEVGAGSVLNPAAQPPSPYANAQPGSRNQFLFLAGELQAAGMTEGAISGIGFNVFQASTTSFEGFAIKMGHSSVPELSVEWEIGLDDVWGPQEFTDTPGWAMHAFPTPFVWDGVSNLVIETCYYNGDATQNAQVYQSLTSFTSCVARLSPNPTICNDGGGTHIPYSQRPNLRFEWQALEAPPVASPTASSLQSCTGEITFSNQSTILVDTWEWDLGDGNSSTDEVVEHTYTNSGEYTITVIVTNPFGADTASLTVMVDLDALAPVDACDVPSAGNVSGFGVLGVTIAGLSYQSGDAASEGYQDNTCLSADLVQGTEFNIIITTGATSTHAVRAWIDWDNSGEFTPNELVLSGVGPVLSASVLVPGSAVLDLPLRTRIIAAYDLVTPMPQPCDTVRFGQAEDYTVFVSENTEPPIAFFTAFPLYTCDGAVQFMDHSINTPTAWAWDFGDGNTSDEEDPMHVYSASGTYSISLTAINTHGEDDTLFVDMVTVHLTGQLTPAACTPVTQSYCCGYGILGFTFAGINSTSTDGMEGYRDRSCGELAQVVEGQTYAWSVTTTAATPHDVRIWMDMNNDGAFSASELVATALDQVSPSGTIQVPSGVVYDQPVRLRVQADVIGQINAPCADPLLGQVEDFGVSVAQNTAPPVAAIGASPSVTCDGEVQFTNNSANVSDEWFWDFGDGTTSSEEDPLHMYAVTGVFTVTLTATNSFGSNTATEVDLIEFVPPWQCDTLLVNAQLDQTTNECLGIMADDGGPNGNYLPGTSGAYTIAPTGAQTVALQFSQFQWGNNPGRTLAFYDGPSVASPLIGRYFGNGLAQLPGGGLVVSSGPSITLRQEQQGGGPANNPGFLLSWNCSFTGITERHAEQILSVRPAPANEQFSVDLEADPGRERWLLIINVTGQILHKQLIAMNVNTITVDSSDYPSGLYAVHVVSGSDRSTRNLIIQ